uniref:hypothetical protein n=1 Tax=Mucilaginibacter sabulilitoris TaxID=1173583 RepID=UPI0038993E27
MQLQGKGKLKIEDTFVKYFPEFPYPTVTIKQLLGHTSGIPDKEELFFPIIEKQPERLFSNSDIIPAMIPSSLKLFTVKLKLEVLVPPLIFRFSV